EPGVSITAEVTAEGLVYREAGSALGLRLRPLKERHRVTLLRDDTVLDVSIITLVASVQRRTFCAKAPVMNEERDVLARLLLHAALHLGDELAPWAALHMDAMSRTLAEAAAEAERAEAAQRAAEADAAWEAGRDVLEDPALLYRVGEVAQKLGLAGEDVSVCL